MDNTEHLGKLTVEHQVRRGIRRGTHISGNDFSGFQLQYHDIFRFQVIIGNTAGLDGHIGTGRIDAADITPGQHHQPRCTQLAVRFVYLLA